MQNSRDSDISKAAGLLQAGKLVAFPTETVYGLGADATNDSAVTAIFQAKGRPSNNPLIVHVSSFEKLCECVDFSNKELSARIRNHLNSLAPLWPGPLSVVVPRAAHISPIVAAGGSTVALRIPDHPLALQLLRACDLPIAAPSANPSMYISPTCAQHVRDGLEDSVAFVLDGGDCAIGIESTVLSLVDSPPAILRPGAITRDQLETALGCPVVIRSQQNSNDAPLPSPGMLVKHYAPHTKVLLLSSVTEKTPLPSKIGAIVFSTQTSLPISPARIKVLSETRNLNEVAAQLFSALRELDAAGLDLILVDTCEPIGMGAAIMDRLLRASCPEKR